MELVPDQAGVPSEPAVINPKIYLAEPTELENPTTSNAGDTDTSINGAKILSA